ncbi:hypothetical protein FDG2_0527 [Candidatus Protofrankia californiensis]|uniref:Uncharacterized protein n=1 Tax=Candidatus Protofrankia californiensis TaxID=1839754 RepID=A0A1C3NTT1_9ACTN|nr:hypothetical protein FDG2_0527 [Candidatus Protofrankia californiensis]
MTATNSGAKYYWPWYGYTTGCGTTYTYNTYTYNTYATDSNGIQYATVELGVFRAARWRAPERRPSPSGRAPETADRLAAEQWPRRMFWTDACPEPITWAERRRFSPRSAAG